jgi:hypothetical protein
MDADKIIEENSRRKKEANTPYDPILGIGCAGEREWMKIKDAPFPSLYLPKAMLRENLCKLLKKHGSIKALLIASDIPYNNESYLELWVSFCELRAKYDFEFFAHIWEVIKDANTAEKVKFKAKRGQRELLGVLENMRIHNAPIRVIILKARQLGLSTLTQLYMFWIQAVHKKNWDSVICAHVKDAANNIRAMYDRVIEHMPPINGIKFTVRPFNKMQNSNVVPERGCCISVGSAENPDSIRGQSPKMVHFSEVSSYPNTEKKGTSELIASISSPVRLDPYTIIIYESTAKGVGDFFHGEWLKAMRGESAFTPVFLPWYYDDSYTVPVVNDYFNHSGKKIKGTLSDFILSLTDQELNKWHKHKNCTLENINWYRGKSAEYPSDELMKQEFPWDADEAFRNSGTPVFRQSDIEEMRAFCKQPVALGDLVSDCSPTEASVNPKKRKEVIRNVRFVWDGEATKAIEGSDPKLKELKCKNKLKVWEYPDDSMSISNRYVVVLDPQKGRTSKADWGVITVIDRYWMMYGGKPEVVAEWRGRIDKDILAWLSVQVAVYYNHALLVIESNTFDTANNKEDDSEFILDTIKDYYDNLYSRTPADKIIEGVPVKHGFHTNRSTKTMIIEHYTTMLRDKKYYERSGEALDEAVTYEEKLDGSCGAKDGLHDDILMSRMIGLFVAYNEMSLPAVIAENRNKSKTATSESLYRF